MNWIPIAEFNKIYNHSLNRIVFRTKNHRLVILSRDFQPGWHIDKYNIIDFIILPE